MNTKRRAVELALAQGKFTDGGVKARKNVSAETGEDLETLERGRLLRMRAGPAQDSGEEERVVTSAWYEKGPDMPES